jgi:hypothetical protein
MDAGDPLSPLDPDYTVADIGALYFNHSAISIPRAIDDLVISRSGNDVELSWSPVTTDTSGNPITISRYFIYASDDPSAADSIGYVTQPDTSFMETNALLAGDKRFYNVKAVEGDR